MDKSELQKKIEETKELNGKFEALGESLSGDMPSTESNDDLQKWFDVVSEDLMNDVIPQRIIDILNHQIDDLRLPTLLNRNYNFTQQGIWDKYKEERSRQVDLCKKYLQIYQLFKSIDYAEKNTVIIGANGSGKTTLANNLKETLNIEDGVVIPAQKLLLVPTFDAIPSYKTECKSFPIYQKAVLDDKRTYVSRSNDDIPYDIAKEYTSEYRRVLALLVGERNYERGVYLDNKPDGSQYNKSEIRTTLDVVVEIWNELITHRTLALTPESIPFLINENNGENKEYAAYQMSDGERIILYLVARVIQAPRNGLIIVDEPEVFLHRTVVDKLWNRLESERKDCTFIYMTHDLQFAASRVATKSWIKEYLYPSAWNIQLIDESDIPEQLLMELLGSCKQVLFCEGNSTSSYDKKIFDVLFPDFIVRPVESCKEVVSYTKAYNSIPNTNTKAVGIVDSDFRSKEEIAQLKANNIFTYGVAEIENVFLTESFLKAFKEYYRCEEDVDKIKAGILARFEKNKESQCSNYVSAKIDFYYRKHHVHKGETKSEVEKNLKLFNGDIDIEKWYNDRMRELNLYINNKSYEKVIGLYNNKGLHSVVEEVFEIKGFNKKAMSFLKVAPVTVLDELRKLFPAELHSTTKNQ